MGSRPSTRTAPAVGRRYPSSVSTVVVFPAPLGPSRASTSPAPADNEIPSTGVTSPYRTTRSDMSTAAIGGDATVATEMIDIQLVRNDPDGVKKALARKKVDPSDVDQLVAADQRFREFSGQRDAQRARKKDLSRLFGEAKKKRDDAQADRIRRESQLLDEVEHKLDSDTNAAEAERRDLLLRIPNIPADDAIDGDSEEHNLVVRTERYDPFGYAEHQRVPHWEIGVELGILDNERAAKISGSMFAMPRRQGATLSRALCQLALDRNADDFEEVRPPTLVTTATLTATGQLPKFADDAYHVERDDLWLIPTAEVPLTSMAKDEIIDEAELPIRLMAYTPCYRREAGSAGRDTRGLLRSHEFDKVELLAYTTPSQGPRLMDAITLRAQSALSALGP